MTTSALPGAKPASHPAGYVPAFGDADGQEDPAPGAVVTVVAVPESGVAAALPDPAAPVDPTATQTVAQKPPPLEGRS